jgi:hypothetical protein
MPQYSTGVVLTETLMFAPQCPQVVTSALEFLPGFTCIILAGHIQSPRTQQYVDAATLSTMASCQSFAFSCGRSLIFVIVWVW